MTLITRTDWDPNQKAYLTRLIVVAEPVTTTAQSITEVDQ